MEDKEQKIELGDRVVDTLTGFKGIVMGKIDYMYGCRQFQVQPKADKKGEWKSAKWLDEPQLKIVKKGDYKPTEPKFGGHREHP